MDGFKPIIYERGSLEIIDQLKIPKETVYIEIKNVEDGWNAIRNMNTRGAPAIAITGCLSLAVELYHNSYQDVAMLKSEIIEKLNYLVTARPTAVNMHAAAECFKIDLEKCQLDVEQLKVFMIEKFERMLADDIATNKLIGENGATEIGKNQKVKLNILTHCNTGSLATAGYGTALGVIRSLYKSGRLNHAYCTETRPYNQGSRLTAYELVTDSIPSTLIADSMVSAAIREHNIDAIVVGADRVSYNGDTANKIGTLQLGIVAKYFGIPFYIASPLTTIDFECESGSQIKIEERSHNELTHIGNERIAAEGIQIWNPAFDVVPASLITRIITEKGCFKPDQIKDLNN